MSTERFKVRAAVYLMPIKDNRILLLRRFNTGWMDGKYSLIAGHLDGGESVSDAIIREAREEALLDIEKDELIPVTVIHRNAEDAEYLDFFFAVKSWIGEPKIGESEKCDSLDWFEIDNLPENILPSVRKVIESYPNNSPFAEHGWS